MRDRGTLRDVHSEGLGRSVFNYLNSESMPVPSVEQYNGHKQLLLMPFDLLFVFSSIKLVNNRLNVGQWVW